MLSASVYNRGVFLSRFTPTGSLDRTFGTDGQAAITFSGVVRTQPDGRIVVVGSNGKTSPQETATLLLARYNSDGSPDATFGTGGNTVGNFSPAGGSSGDFVLQPNGSFVVAGRAGGDPLGDRLALTRFDTRGRQETSFGTCGTATADLPDPNGLFAPTSASVVLLPDGRIVEAGSALANGMSQFGLARFLPGEPTSDPNQRFVTQVYCDVLQRPVDPGGLAYWSGLLNQGTSRTDVVQRIEGSLEYRTVVVQGLYQKFLGRAADPGGLNSFVQSLSNGATIEAVEAIILGSPEYFIRAGGDSFLGPVYHDVLGRHPDPLGLIAFGGALAVNVSRTTVALAIITSVEANQHLVQLFFQRFLRRPADSFGLNSFAGALQHGVRDEAVLAAIVSSAEYFDRI